MNKNKKPPVYKPVPKKSVAAPAAHLPENDLFYKIIWYAMCFFLAFLFLELLKSKLPHENESKTLFFDGTFQDQFEDNLLKKPFVTILKKNKYEYEFKLFNKVNLEGFYEGKDNYIFAEERTAAFFGDDYFGTQTIHNEVQKAQYVQGKLKELGIQLLILFAPVKSDIYSAMLPDYVLKTERKTSNYESYVKECKEQKVNFIDFVKYFKSLKLSQPQFPLFSRYGSHWSYYAECIAVDTTIKRLEGLMNLHLPELHYGGIQLKDTSLVRDGDIFRKMNIDIPKGNILAYPENIGYRGTPDAKPEKILGIGDSYFRCFFYLGAMDKAFDNSVQWYYNNSIIPEDPSNPEVWQLDLKNEIIKVKAIVLMCNEVNLKTLGDGFIDDAYELFSNPVKYYADKKQKDALNEQKKEIRNNKDILNRLTKESQQFGIPLDTLITGEAKKRLI